MTKTPGIYASGVVSLIQSFSIFTLYSIGVFVDLFPEQKGLDNFSVRIYGLIIVIPLMVFNWYRYEKNPRLKEMNEKWGTEDERIKLIKGWLIIFGILLVIITPFKIAGILFDRNHSILKR